MRLVVGHNELYEAYVHGGAHLCGDRLAARTDQVGAAMAANQASTPIAQRPQQPQLTTGVVGLKPIG